jgi:hypothetical protein
VGATRIGAGVVGIGAGVVDIGAGVVAIGTIVVCVGACVLRVFRGVAFVGKGVARLAVISGVVGGEVVGAAKVLVEDDPAGERTVVSESEPDVSDAISAAAPATSTMTARINPERLVI